MRVPETNAVERHPRPQRAFIYLPLMHTEDLAQQDECVDRFTQLHADVPDALREVEIVNIPFLGALAGCSARRSERRVASHTSEGQRCNAPVSAAMNGILAFSASLKPSIQSHLESAQQHRDIIAWFGRFPYRNAVLGRTSTALEQDFLTNGPRFGH